MTAEQLVAIVATVEESEARPDDQIALLMDAAAFICAEHDFNPEGAAERLRASFETLHVAKCLGRTQ